jgi:hypothetical protein
MTYDINANVDKFATAVGNGATMGKLFREAVDYVIASRDTTVILRMMQRAVKRGDKGAANLVRSTFGSVFVGAKFTTKAGNVVGIKIKDAELSNWAVDTLHMLTDDKASMRGKKWKDAFKTEKETPAFDLQAFVARAMKAHPEVSKAAFAAAFQAA